LGETIADLSLGVAILHLLRQVTPLVGDFDNKLSHFSLNSDYSSVQSNTERYWFCSHLAPKCTYGNVIVETLFAMSKSAPMGCPVQVEAFSVRPSALPKSRTKPRDPLRLGGSAVFNVGHSFAGAPSKLRLGGFSTSIHCPPFSVSITSVPDGTVNRNCLSATSTFSFKLLNLYSVTESSTA